MTSTVTMPEDILLATLHKVGPNVRIADNFDLAKIFDSAAKKHQGFAKFKSHPQYHFSRGLTAALQLLDHAGSIVRENAAQTFFKVSPHAAGPYGASVFDALDDEHKAAVDEVAAEICSCFQGQPK